MNSVQGKNIMFVGQYIQMNHRVGPGHLHTEGRAYRISTIADPTLCEL